MVARSDHEKYYIETECKSDEKQASNDITAADHDRISDACIKFLFSRDDNQETKKSEIQVKKQILEDLSMFICTPNRN